MDFNQENINNFLKPLRFDEMDFKLGDFSVVHNSTRLVVEVKIDAIKERLNKLSGVDGWNLEIEKIGVHSLNAKGLMKLKTVSGNWISRSVVEKLKLKESTSTKQLLLKKAVDDLHIGGKIQERYPSVYLLGNLKSISKLHLSEIKSIHEMVCASKNIPEEIKIGTGKNIFDNLVVNNNLSSKQINFLSEAADIFGEKGKVQDQILKGEISKDNFFTNISKYGYTIERIDNKLSSEQLDQMNKIAIEHSEILSMKGYSIEDDIKSGRINNANYDEILEDYLQLIRNENNLGYQR